jgi:DNA-binding response OmpR family regulator
LGANAYVVKPVDFDEYRERLDRIVDFWLSHNRSPVD